MPGSNNEIFALPVYRQTDLDDGHCEFSILETGRDKGVEKKEST